MRLPRKDCFRAGRVEAVMLEPPASDNAGDSVSNFVKRTERAWLISKVISPLNLDGMISKHCSARYKHIMTILRRSSNFLAAIQRL